MPIAATFIAEREWIVEPQFLQTPTGEELVVLSRHDYDALLARLGDENAEDRLLSEMAERTRRDLASGREFLLPVWFSEGLIAHRNPVRAVRVHAARSLAEMAAAIGLPEARLAMIEGGTEQPSTANLDAMSASAGIDPRILRRMYDASDAG